MSENSKPKRRWVPVLLVASLALNLLVAGAVFGTAMRFKGEDEARKPPGFGPALFRALPKPERKALRADLSGLRDKGADARDRDFDALNLALRQVPFDPAAVETLLQEQAQSMARMQAALQQQWLVRISAMTDSERLIYADRLVDIIERGPKGRKSRD